MINTIISYLTTFIVGSAITVLIKFVKHDKIQTGAIRNLLKSNLVNQYYCYEKIGKVPRYVADTWYSMYESYIGLGGNSFVKNDIEPKFRQIEIDND